MASIYTPRFSKPIADGVARCARLDEIAVSQGDSSCDFGAHWTHYVQGMPSTVGMKARSAALSDARVRAGA